MLKTNTILPVLIFDEVVKYEPINYRPLKELLKLFTFTLFKNSN